MTTSLETIKKLITRMKADFDAISSGGLQDNRRLFNESGLKATLPEGMQVESVTINDWISGDWLIPAASASLPASLSTNPGKIILYFHGGGYSVGSSLSHRPICARIAASSHCKVFSLNYRLAPEHKYPAALDDALECYQWLLKSYPATGIVFAGDSAGGGLVMASLLAIRQRNLPMPAGAIGISAWLDLECSSNSYQDNKGIDMLATAEGLRFVGRAYANKQTNKNPLVSPFYANDLQGLCPLLIQVGSAETLRDENTIFADRASNDGVTVTLQVWPNMVHVWHSLYGSIPEAKEAIDAIARWIQALP